MAKRETSKSSFLRAGVAVLASAKEKSLVGWFFGQSYIGIMVLKFSEHSGDFVPRTMTHGTWEYTPGKGKSSSKPSFSGSMLIFVGVPHTLSFPLGGGENPSDLLPTKSYEDKAHSHKPDIDHKLSWGTFSWWDVFTSSIHIVQVTWNFFSVINGTCFFPWVEQAFWVESLWYFMLPGWTWITEKACN